MNFNFAIRAFLFLAVPLFSSASLAKEKAPSVSMVEVQWVLCEPNEAVFFQKLNFRPQSPSPRDVFYSDTQNLAMFHRGGLLRTRISKDHFKTTAKIRPPNEASIPWKFLEGKDYKCEYDAYSSGASIGCSLYYKPQSMQQLRSADQEFMIQKQTGFSDFASLMVLGPARSLEWEWSDSQTREDLVLESMRTSNGFYSLELSTRVPIERAQGAAQKITRWLAFHNVQQCSQQKGKTEELLGFLAKLAH